MGDDTALELSPAAARQRQIAGAPLLDLRAADERAEAAPAGAVALDAAQVPSWLQAHPAAMGVLLLCTIGARSRQLAQDLRVQGIAAWSVAGGMLGWLATGLPVAEAALDAAAQERYARQLLLPEVGAAGQRRLAQSSVALVGVGGLGAPAVLYLAAAGVGRLTLLDDDCIERSNLQRQVLYDDAAVGQPKVQAAAQRLLALNPTLRVTAHAQRLHAGNAHALLAGHDVLLDGSDNLATRYVLADASEALRLPLVYGAVQGFSGQLSVFDPRRSDSPCYRCLFPQAPTQAPPDCTVAGVLGVVPGLIGMLQAAETLKLLLALGTPLVGRLLQVDVLTLRMHESRLPRDPACPLCAARAAGRPAGRPAAGSPAG